MKETLKEMVKRIINEEMNQDTLIMIYQNDKYGKSTWYLQGIDSEHVKISNTDQAFDRNAKIYKINDLRTKPYYNDVRTWLMGGKSPDGKTY